jgi:hypothetical protein
MQHDGSLLSDEVSKCMVTHLLQVTGTHNGSITGRRTDPIKSLLHRTPWLAASQDCSKVQQATPVDVASVLLANLKTLEAMQLGNARASCLRGRVTSQQ